mmetsp:Transcript_89886/g.159930  ORF Transcript_89886/g.159930 Transcript_89886/m.159930 type:complete len:199 (+) Transcript_89886:57-653(+)
MMMVIAMAIFVLVTAIAMVQAEVTCGEPLPSMGELCTQIKDEASCPKYFARSGGQGIACGWVSGNCLAQSFCSIPSGPTWTSLPLTPGPQGNWKMGGYCATTTNGLRGPCCWTTKAAYPTKEKCKEFCLGSEGCAAVAWGQTGAECNLHFLSKPGSCPAGTNAACADAGNTVSEIKYSYQAPSEHHLADAECLLLDRH